MNSASDNHLKVAVIGGGISGLTSAYFLLQSGVSVTLFEAGHTLGGLGTYFDAGFSYVDKFYHCILPTDNHLLDLIEKLGLKPQMVWSESKMGFFYRGKNYPLNTPADLLRFKPLPFTDRLRMGWSAIRVRRQKDPERLDTITAESWIRENFGHRAFDTFWKALLQAKFGDRYDQVPAYWIWNRMVREKTTDKEVKGILRGGLKVLIDSLASAIEQMGGTLRMDTPVEHIKVVHDSTLVRHGGENELFDAVVATTPTHLLHRMLDDGPEAALLENKILEYQGVVNVIIASKEKLDRYYWTMVVDSGVPFQGIVETTNLLHIEETRGHHLIYLLNYVSADHPLFREDKELIAQRYLEALLGLYPSFHPGNVVFAKVFRTPHVEPVYTLNQLQRQVPKVLAPGRLYLTNTTQIYPQVNSWTTCVQHASVLAATVLDQMRKTRFPRIGVSL